MTTTQQAPGGGEVVLPLTVDEITATWLTEALSQRFPGLEVSDVKVVDIIWGTATKVRIEVSYTADPGPDGPPTRLCVKGGFDERVREAMGGVGDEGVRSEGEFFRDLAPVLDVSLPRYWYADANVAQGVVILDDLATDGIVFGTPAENWSPEKLAVGLDELARFHAETWGREYPGIPWVGVGSIPVRGAVRHLFSPAHWDVWFTTPDAPILPEELRDGQRNLRGYEALWQHDDASELCLVHGDAHLGNTYIDETGKPYFLDWASVSRCPWSHDVTYFLVGGLSIEDRRAHERQLLDGYLASLSKYGGPTLDPAEAWADYRRHAIHGLIWATLPAVLQSPENVRAMSDRFVAAIVDHDVLNLLGV